jgi:hypothetical protein
MEESQLRELIKYHVKTYKDLKDNVDNLNLNTPMLGIVIDTAKNTSNSNTYYSFGSVKIQIPHTASAGSEYVWASPLRNLSGSFDIPFIGSTVLVYFLGSPSDGSVRHFYSNISTMDANPFAEYPGYGDYFNTEKIGFTFKPSIAYKGHIGGRYVKNVMENPGEAKLISSTNTFVFYQSDKDKEIHLKGANDYFIKMHVGDKGKIQMGYLDEITDSTQTGSADMEIDLGIEGYATVQTIDGSVVVKTTTGDIKLQSGNNYINITPSGIYIVGNTYISGTTMVSQEIHWKTVGFTPTGNPPYNTALANKGSTHMHPTAVPGPPSPPTPGT